MSKTKGNELIQIHRLAQIFEAEQTDDGLSNEEKGFSVDYSTEDNVLQVRINTFVNPYTQDVPSVYKNRLSRLDFLKRIATIEAYEPSRLGSK